MVLCSGDFIQAFHFLPPADSASAEMSLPPPGSGDPGWFIYTPRWAHLVSIPGNAGRQAETGTISSATLTHFFPFDYPPPFPWHWATPSPSLPELHAPVSLQVMGRSQTHFTAGETEAQSGGVTRA